MTPPELLPIPYLPARNRICAETTTVLQRIDTYRTNTLWVYIIPAFLLAGLWSACTTYYANTAVTPTQVRVYDIGPDSAVQAIIAPYKASLDAEMQSVVGEIGVDMRRAKPESTLGNFICDVVESEAERITGTAIDFGVYNYGGIRQEYLNKGPVTKGKIYELLPFENFGAIVTLDGPSTHALITKIVEEGGWPVSAGLKIVVRNHVPDSIYIDGAPFDSTRTYRVVMNDYMANGGDRMPFIKKEQVTVMGVTIRDMMLHYLSALQAQGKAATAQIEGRIVYAD